MQGNTNKAPILIQWEGEESKTDPSQNARSLNGNETQDDEKNDIDDELKQIVTFQDCVFQENLVDDSTSFPGVIENTFNSELNVNNCLFKDNVYGSMNNPSNMGYAIRSFGPLTLNSSCFIDNVFLKFGPVLIYGVQYSATNNYVKSSQTGLTCEFGSLFSSKDDTAETIPTCQMSDVNTCGFSQNPTVSPTFNPSPAPVDMAKGEASKSESSGPISGKIILTGSIISLIIQCLLIISS